MTKEQVLAFVKKYIEERNRGYDNIVDDPVEFNTNEEVIHGKYKGEERDLWTVCYEVEWFDGPMSFFVIVDDETEEVLYTMTPSGYAEDWEEGISKP